MKTLKSTNIIRFDILFDDVGLPPPKMYRFRKN